MKTSVQDLLKEPNIALVIEELQRILKEEAQLRQQFYEDITEQQKAEFINGEVVLHSPVTIEHNLVLKRLLVIMELHVQMYSLGFIGYEKLMIHLTRNSYEPDLCYFTPEQSSVFEKEQKIFPSPTLVVEVLSHSTEHNDRTIKYEDYQAHGVKEYWIIDPYKEVLEQYILKKNKYQLQHKIRKGKITSTVIPGFSFETLCLFDEEKYLEFVEFDKRQIMQLTRIEKEKETKIQEQHKEITEKENLKLE